MVYVVLLSQPPPVLPVPCARLSQLRFERGTLAAVTLNQRAAGVDNLKCTENSTFMKGRINDLSGLNKTSFREP